MNFTFIDCPKNSELSVSDLRCKHNVFTPKECLLPDCEYGPEAGKAKFEQKLLELEKECKFFTPGTILDKDHAKNIYGEEELRKYELLCKNMIGRGSFGGVYLMREKESGKYVAVKVLNKHRDLKSIEQEIEVHRRLNHSNIVRLHKCIFGKTKIFLVMEYANNKSLLELLKRKKKLSETQAYYFFRQVCNAIHFLHRNKLMHRDIKPANLLFFDNGVLKLCDFGFCTDSSETRRTFCGTLEYIAPEILKRSGYNEKADIWSLGVLLYEMLNGFLPFVGHRASEIKGKILDHTILFNPSVPQDAQDFIRAMLSEDPLNRPSVLELLTFPWMQRMQKEFDSKTPRGSIETARSELRKSLILTESCKTEPSVLGEGPECLRASLQNTLSLRKSIASLATMTLAGSMTKRKDKKCVKSALTKRKESPSIWSRLFSLVNDSDL